MIAQECMTKTSLLVFNFTVCTIFSNNIEIVIFADLFIIHLHVVLVKFPINLIDLQVHVLYADFFFNWMSKREKVVQSFVIFITGSDFAGWVILLKEKEFQLHLENFCDSLYAFCKCDSISCSLQSSSLVSNNLYWQIYKTLQLPLQNTGSA
jgi:hypothetical protein